MKISIITPSYNSADTLKRAIESVLLQKYKDFEHIVVDGGSTDGTLDILKHYPHLQWISERDRGQVHAMNKGFDMATGEIIGYLNADDFYLEDVFSTVLSHFRKGEKMVMGKVLVRSEMGNDVIEWTCDPKTDFLSAIRHWESNAFCVNPVGYFYLREVQESIPLREETGAKHDLEFLIEASFSYSIIKVDKMMGVFNHKAETQTGKEQLLPSYWLPENFAFVDRFLKHLPQQGQKKFKLDQERGYQLRRQWTAKEAFSRGMAKELFDNSEVFLLPEDENDCNENRCGFVEHNTIGTKGDWIIPVVTIGKADSILIYSLLKSLPNSVCPAGIYRVDTVNHNSSTYSIRNKVAFDYCQSVSLSLQRLFKEDSNEIRWKYIIGVRNPIEDALSEYLHDNPNPHPNNDEILEHVKNSIQCWNEYFIAQLQIDTGINIFDHDFDHDKKYTIICSNNLEILIFRLEDLPQVFFPVIEKYLGIQKEDFSNINIDTVEKYATSYKTTNSTIGFDNSLLELAYPSKRVMHFYTKPEIHAFINKWLNFKNNQDKFSENKNK